MLSLLAALLVLDPWIDFGLSDPFRVVAGKQAVDVTHGHAHPLLTDFDGDGTPDLLVGQFQDGMLRVYPGKPGQGARSFGDPSFFQAGGVDARVSYG